MFVDRTVFWVHVGHFGIVTRVNAVRTSDASLVLLLACAHVVGFIVCVCTCGWCACGDPRYIFLSLLLVL